MHTFKYFLQNLPIYKKKSDESFQQLKVYLSILN